MDVRPSRTAATPSVVAAAQLHNLQLDAGGVVDALVRLVDDLGLGASAVFVPAAPSDAAAPTAAHSEVPVRAPGGPMFGTLRLVPADDEALGEVEALAVHAGAALQALLALSDSRRREQAARRVSERLQDALLPPVPAVAHSVVEVRYRAASLQARVGGDFYDVFPLPDGRVLLVVGDVVGKGVEAAVRTSRITQTLRALALEGVDLEVLLRRCDEQVTYQDPDIMATVWCGLYEPDSGELDFASLGHPPAVLLRDEGSSSISLELHGLPLGMRELLDEAPECRNRRLEPGDLLVLYTDGLVETARDFLAGQQALLEAVERRRDQRLVDLIEGALDELLTGAEHRDDAVMLLLRRR